MGGMLHLLWAQLRRPTLWGPRSCGGAEVRGGSGVGVSGSGPSQAAGFGYYCPFRHLIGPLGLMDGSHTRETWKLHSPTGPEEPCLHHLWGPLWAGGPGGPAACLYPQIGSALILPICSKKNLQRPRVSTHLFHKCI